MKQFLEQSLILEEAPSEEKESQNLSDLTKDLSVLISSLNRHECANFYGELITKIRTLIYSYVKEQQNSKLSPVHKYLYLLYDLFQKIAEYSFMNKNFFLNFLYKRIFSYYNPLEPNQNDNIMLINDIIVHLCTENKRPIFYHCINYIVNMYFFQDVKNLSKFDYIFKYFINNGGYVDFFSIGNNILEAYFSQLICLDDFASESMKLKLKEEKDAKEFIESSFSEFYNYDIQSQIENIIIQFQNNEEKSIKFSFKNDTSHLLRHLRNSIISVFTPVDQSILNYFETYVYKYFEPKIFQDDDEEAEFDIKLDIFGELFLSNTIQDVDVKIRNLSFLIDIILQNHFKIDYIPEIDLLKFPRLNIVMNRLFEDIEFNATSPKEITNIIFEHFIISQFMYNYIKYQVKDPEHYPIEIRYFVIFSYIKISESYLLTNPFTSYITSITFRELIRFLELEKDFKKQKYIKASKSKKLNESNSNNNELNYLMNKNSPNKSKFKKSSSRKKKNKKKNRKKSMRKTEVNQDKNPNMNINIIENIIKTESKINVNISQSKSKSSFLNEENSEKPNKLISTTLFNYLCFIYSMQYKFKNYSNYFEELYSFIDEYIDENIKEKSLEQDWEWLFIYSIKYIKKFDLSKSYEKFIKNINKDNLEQNIDLIAFLSKKVKYGNTQERFLILDVIYYILINFKDLPKIQRMNKYSSKFKKLNRGLSFLSFNINFSMKSDDNMSPIDQELVGDKLFKITNLLFIESLDEYFWIPKTLIGYKNFNEFIQILDRKFNKSLYKRSQYSETFLKGLVAVKKYINDYLNSSKNKSKKEKEYEQYLMSLDYFCKIEFETLKTIDDVKNISTTKEKIISLMKLCPDYDLKYDLNGKVDVIKNILLSGDFDLRICLFLICQLITNKILEENSPEIELINSIFAFLIKPNYKFMINFLLTLYKSIEKYLSNLINQYVQAKFGENREFSKKEYSKFLDLFNPKKPVDKNNETGKEIQIVYNNWTLIQKKLVDTDTFYKFLLNLEKLNYPKSVMNLIEKFIFDLTRKKNIHNFNDISDNIPEKKYIKEIFKKYLSLYYRAYSHIEDNKIILDNYFDNNALLKLIGKYNKENSKSSDNKIIMDNVIYSLNQYMISLNYNILKVLFSSRDKISQPNDDNYIYLKIILFLYNIRILNSKNIEMKKRKFIFSMLKEMESNAILEILGHNNKLNETYNCINSSLWLYELTIYLEEFERYFSKCATNTDFINNFSALSLKLRNIFINKRRIPHVKRFLFIFEFRRFLFNLYGDVISELYCLVDICKVYKSIYETGISIDEENNFMEYLKIFTNILLELDKQKSNILINIDKKLFFVPLKYYVKFFPGVSEIHFEKLFDLYKSLFTKKNKNLFSYKIIILNEKLKAKNGVVGINKVLEEKIKTLKSLRNNSEYNKQDGLLYYTDFYLDLLLTNESEFKSIKPREMINKIQIGDFNESIFRYLEGSINICSLTDKEKYLRKYMPEIINLFFKMNLAHINIMKNNILYTQTQSLIDENMNKYIQLLDKFRKEVSINKVKIIIPQLIICYQYENTYLYNFAIELLASYAQQNIDLIAYLLSSFLIFNKNDMRTIGIRTSRNDSHSFRYDNFSNIFEKSKNFVELIKNKLSLNNQKILKGYEEFCKNLSILYYECRKTSSTKQPNIIKNINESLRNNNIILPTLENINRYNSSVRNNNNNDFDNKILFLDKLESTIVSLSSKEKPLHIIFKTRTISKNYYPKKSYDFLLKCDVNDITKEIKTFEIIDEINNIFKIKHYDTNDSMSLKRYLMVPIAPTIILAEWLNDCVSFSSVIDEQSQKDLIYQNEFKTIIRNDNNKQYIIPGSLVNLEEKFNVLYNYFQYNFFDPNIWYNAKKKYIISTAIWSMTSYLVGLGDRHPANIMLNKEDGEIVHIDFGYVALKGLSLGVPEIVEFRLTFNLKKNLGLFEENGLFNYICVKALKTFKEYYKTLSARIEYYQFDPLFDNENDNKTFKLFDQNDNFFSALDNVNVKMKLKELIVKNTNPENLEKMYVWWSPWI